MLLIMNPEDKRPVPNWLPHNDIDIIFLSHSVTVAYQYLNIQIINDQNISTFILYSTDTTLNKTSQKFFILFFKLIYKKFKRNPFVLI